MFYGLKVSNIPEMEAGKADCLKAKVLLEASV